MNIGQIVVTVADITLPNSVVKAGTIAKVVGLSAKRPGAWSVLDVTEGRQVSNSILRPATKEEISVYFHGHREQSELPPGRASLAPCPVPALPIERYRPVFPCYLWKADTRGIPPMWLRLPGLSFSADTYTHWLPIDADPQVGLVLGASSAPDDLDSKSEQEVNEIFAVEVAGLVRTDSGAFRSKPGAATIACITPDMLDYCQIAEEVLPFASSWSASLLSGEVYTVTTEGATATDRNFARALAVALIRRARLAR